MSNMRVKPIKIDNFFLIIPLSIIFVMLSITGIVFYKIYMNKIITEVTNMGNEKINYASDKLKQKIKEVERISKMLSNNPVMLGCLNTLGDINLDNITTIVETNNSIDTLFDTMKMTNRLIDKIELYLSAQDNIHLQDNTNWISYQELLQNNYAISMLNENNNTHIFLVDDLKQGNSMYNQLCVVSKIFSQDGQTEGFLILKIKENWMDMPDNDVRNIGIFTNSGDLISSSLLEVDAKDLLARKASRDSSGDFYINNNGYFTLCNDFLLIDNTVIIAKYDYSAKLALMRRQILIFVLSLIIVIAFFSYLILNIFRKKIRDIFKELKEHVLKMRENIDKRAYIKRQTYLREKIMIYLLITVVLSMTAYFIGNNIMFNNFYRNILIDSYNITQQRLSSNLNKLVSVNIGTIDTISMDDDVQSVLLYYFQDKPEEIKEGELLNLFFNVRNYLSLGDNIDEVRLYTKDGQLVFSTDDFSVKRLQSEAIPDQPGEVHIYEAKDSDGNKVMRINKQIRSINSQVLDLIGYISVDIQEEVLMQICASTVQNGIEVTASSNNYVITMNNQRQLGDTVALDKNSNGIVIRHDPNNQLIFEPGSENYLQVQLKMPYSNIKDNYRSSTYLIINIIMLELIIFMVFGYWCAYYIIKKINRIVDSFSKIDMKTFHLKRTDKSKFKFMEIEFINNVFMELLFKIDALMNELVSREVFEKDLRRQKKEMEVAALCSQLNPHFICNALETVKNLMTMSEINKAEEMISKFSEWFRLGIRWDIEMITIYEEMEYTRTYMDIQRVRFGENLTFIEDIDADILNCMTLKLILQPLVENCIHHGFDNHKNGIVKIQGFRKENFIQIKVSDNGKGFSEQELEQINERLKNKFYNKNVGLYNVNRRLQLHFGEEWGLSIESNPMFGTVVFVRFPYTELT